MKYYRDCFLPDMFWYWRFDESKKQWYRLDPQSGRNVWVEMRTDQVPARDHWLQETSEEEMFLELL